ncbi:MAG: flagellar hook basal-body protein [Gammaproteobacteria bacterium]|nr:flagellar hook basal-body protein [Gammaproteobacteria bacterium]MDH5728916.1 flagellar hook basal-body protein [Gammaproteobacteria bacterium]
MSQDILAIVKSSMNSDLQHLTNASINLANINTPGFKRIQSLTQLNPSAFANTLSDFLEDVGTANRAVTSVNQQVDFSNGSLKHTGNPLDVAIAGPGFFTVQTPNGAMYSRNGIMQLDAQGRLVNGQGFPVVGERGEIFLENDQFKITSQGTIYVDEQMVDRLAIGVQADPSLIDRAGVGLYQLRQAQAVEDQDQTILVYQAHKEQSNVQPLDEMLSLMKLTRHFELTQKMVRAYDDMLDSAINDLAKL